MTKRPSPPNTSQLGFDFGVPERVASDGALDDLGRVVSSAVGAMLKGDGRSRFEIAGAVSRLLDDEVTKLMLDAYASPAREDHRISVDRFLALVAATSRYDVLRSVLNRIGVDALVGEEVYLAEIGHLEAELRDRKARLKQLKSAAQPIDRGGSRR